MQVPAAPPAARGEHIAEGRTPDLVAIITRLRTQFDVTEAAWVHEISVEAWAES